MKQLILPYSKDDKHFFFCYICRIWINQNRKEILLLLLNKSLIYGNFLINLPLGYIFGFSFTKTCFLSSLGSQVLLFSWVNFVSFKIPGAAYRLSRLGYCQNIFSWMRVLCIPSQVLFRSNPQTLHHIFPNLSFSSVFLDEWE